MVNGYSIHYLKEDAKQMLTYHVKLTIKQIKNAYIFYHAIFNYENSIYFQIFGYFICQWTPYLIFYSAFDRE